MINNHKLFLSPGGAPDHKACASSAGMCRGYFSSVISFLRSFTCVLPFFQDRLEAQSKAKDSKISKPSLWMQMAETGLAFLSLCLSLSSLTKAKTSALFCMPHGVCMGAAGVFKPCSLFIISRATLSNWHILINSSTQESSAFLSECITRHFWPKILSKKGMLKGKTDCIKIT